jgi:general secretion pathway protein A
MYESYFGLNAAPFLLNPDPGFFFDSRGHASALSYLKFGLYQAEGFIVITGDIGAGKTTLLRTLLSDIDEEKVVAAQLVSTQLEAGDLLRSTMIAFGLPPKGQTKAELISSLEAYLTLLATQHKRAVLIVDEAQNLSRDAIEELRMLSNFQCGNQALLQSFLIGQPELRDMLLSRSLEQLRQRVIASYHLGPMDRDETRRYVEHRLTLVGWKQDPQITDEAFDEIYQWTTGIPRRINLLCNRVLLSTYLADAHEVNATIVAQVAMEIRAEIGEPLHRLAPPPAEAGAGASAVESRPLHVEPDSRPMPLSPAQGLTPVSNSPGTVASGVAVHAANMTPGEPHFLLIASSRAGCIRAAALQRAFANREELPPLRTLIANTIDGFSLSGDWCQHIGLQMPNIELRLPQGTGAAQLAEAIRQIDSALREYRPGAVMVQAGDEVGLAASLAAHRLGIPTVHIEAGLRSFDRSRAKEVNAMTSDHLGDLLLTSEWVAHDNLSREGLPADRVHFVGNLMMDTIRTLLSQASPPKYTLRQLDLPQDIIKQKHGYAVAYLSSDGIARHGPSLSELTRIFKAISRDLPIIVVTDAPVRQLLEAEHLLDGVPPHQMLILPIVPYFKMIGLIGTAACVFTDATSVQEECTILGIPCMTLHNHTDRRITVEQGTNLALGINSSLIHRTVSEVIQGGGKKGRLPKFWDGQTANRSVEILTAWWKQKYPRPPTH